MGLRSFKKVDVIETLRSVMVRNTTHYQEDFEKDISILRRAATDVYPKHKWLYWMSRECGTYLFYEQDVYFRHTWANSAWRNYAGDHNIITFAVYLTAGDGAQVMGNLYEMDYRKSLEDVEKFSVDTETFAASYQRGTIFYPGYFRIRQIPDYDKNLGGLLFVERLPSEDDGKTLEWNLRQMRDQRMKIKEGLWNTFLGTIEKKTS